MASGVILKGDWRKLRSKFNRMAKGAVRFESDTMKELAEEVKKVLHEVVNSSPEPANSEMTEKRKGFNVPLMETGGMMEEDSIVVTKGYDGGKVTYTVQGNPEKTHERSKQPYSKIVEVAETGGTGIHGSYIPPRHVLSITYSQTRQQIEKLAIKKLNEDLFGE